MQKAISYYRVSTARQGRTGLGLEAQQQSVQAFAQSHSLELLTAFTEIESGRKNNRPILKMALRACKKQNAILVIAKLDRLARNVAFVSSLMEAKVAFIAVDLPYANRFTIHIMAAVAENEREMISARTIQALRVAKERGVQLGRHGKDVLSKQNQDNADHFALYMKPIIADLQKTGITTVRDITQELNRRKVPSFRGDDYRWHPSSIHQIMKRFSRLDAVP